MPPLLIQNVGFWGFLTPDCRSFGPLNSQSPYFGAQLNPKARFPRKVLPRHSQYFWRGLPIGSFPRGELLGAALWMRLEGATLWMGLGATFWKPSGPLSEGMGIARLRATQDGGNGGAMEAHAASKKKCCLQFCVLLFP